MKIMRAIGILWVISQGFAMAGTCSNFTLPSGVDITIVEYDFDAAKFNIEKCSTGGSICRINGRSPYGVDIDYPKTYVRSITASFGKSSYELNVTDMYDAWGARPLSYSGGVRYFGGECTDDNNCRLRGLFSDAAGTFVAEWHIVDGRVSRTVLTNSTDVIELFTKNIDPPGFAKPVSE